MRLQGTSAVAGDNVEQLADEIVEESERASKVMAGLSVTAKDEMQDPATPQSASLETPSEPERSVVEAPEAPPKREVQPSAKPWPDPAERIAELERRTVTSRAESQQRQQEIQARFLQRQQEIEAEFEQRDQEIETESQQRRQEIQARFQQREQESQAEFEQRDQEIRARFGLDPAATPLDPKSASIDSLDMPEDHPPAPAPAQPRSTSSQMSARISEAEEEKQMKELVGMLRGMADVQDRRAHDLRFRDEYNWEADDRQELAEKMTELADEIEMFQRLRNRMKDVESGNPGHE